MEKQGVISTDTYFNSISIGKWKKHTIVDNLFFTIKFKGKIKIEWFVERLHFSSRILKEVILESESLKEHTVPVEMWNQLEDGMLAFNLYALDNSEITTFSYKTETEKKQEIKLGIVITHFNRQQYVLPALDRLKSELFNDPYYANNVEIYVIDNSQNLPNIDAITIIPNENLGGSGGFTRGLMELKEQGHFTHCLFMDDDASFEVEAIKRALSFLSFAKEENLAMAGAMLREAEMFVQFENGAKFDGMCKPLKANLDLRKIHSLLINEQEEQVDYGGWWFFAFPISKVKHYAFPYFVRGDDSGFSLSHDFKIVTLNSISSWQEDFALKNGPLPHYLDTRYHLMHHLHNLVDTSFLGIFKTSASLCLKNLLTYHYDTGLASIIAIEDVLKGSHFWKENVDMAQKRMEIQKIISSEKVIDIPYDISNNVVWGNPNETKLNKLVRLITLNGHLLPKIFFKKDTVWQNKGFGGNLREVFRHKKVLYIHWPTQKGFILEHDKKKFFSYTWRYFKAMYKLFKNYDQLQKEYQSSYTELTSENFWKAQFKSH